MSKFNLKHVVPKRAIAELHIKNVYVCSDLESFEEMYNQSTRNDDPLKKHSGLSIEGYFNMCQRDRLSVIFVERTDGNHYLFQIPYGARQFGEWCVLKSSAKDFTGDVQKESWKFYQNGSLRNKLAEEAEKVLGTNYSAEAVDITIQQVTQELFADLTEALEDMGYETKIVNASVKGTKTIQAKDLLELVTDDNKQDQIADLFRDDYDQEVTLLAIVAKRGNSFEMRHTVYGDNPKKSIDLVIKMTGNYGKVMTSSKSENVKAFILNTFEF